MILLLLALAIIVVSGFVAFLGQRSARFATVRRCKRSRDRLHTRTNSFNRQCYWAAPPNLCISIGPCLTAHFSWSWTRSRHFLSDSRDLRVGRDLRRRISLGMAREKIARRVLVFLQPARGQHGDGGAGAKRRAVSGGVGSDGAQLVFPRHVRGRERERARSWLDLFGGDASRHGVFVGDVHFDRARNWHRSISINLETQQRRVGDLEFVIPARGNWIRHKGGLSCRCTSGCPKRTRRRPATCPH